MKRFRLRKTSAQASVEYMLILSGVAIVVLLGFRDYFPTVQDGVELYYNRASDGIMGDPPACGNGVCEASRLENGTTCCFDCGGCGYDGG